MEAEALDTLVLVLAIAVLSPFISDFATRWMRLPGVVIEIGLGILLGPYVLGWLEIDDIIDFLAEMGLVFLIFLAGFEIDPDVVKGRPVRLAVTGWVISLVLAIGIAAALHSLGVTSGVRFVAVALTTTAIGTLLPILGDAGILDTKLGTNILASGAIGEIGPIIAISLALTSDRPGRTTVVLLAFAGIAAITMWLATRRARTRTVELISRTLHSSGQLGVRICVLLCVLLVWTAAEFDLDVLLGAFAAGMVARLFLVGHAAPRSRERRRRTTTARRCRSVSKRSATASSSPCSSSSAASASTWTRCSTRSSSSRCRCSSASSWSSAACRPCSTAPICSATTSSRSACCKPRGCHSSS